MNSVALHLGEVSVTPYVEYGVLGVVLVAITITLAFLAKVLLAAERERREIRKDRKEERETYIVTMSNHMEHVAESLAKATVVLGAIDQRTAACGRGVTPPSQPPDAA